MKKYIYPMLLAPAFVAAACSSDIDVTNDIPDDQKEQISFSLSDAASSTRAGFTGADTRIVARIQSDETGSTNVKYTRTVLKASKDNTGGATDYSAVDYYTTDNTRYWDDAFGRKSKLSVYAVAIPNTTSDTYLAENKLSGGAWAAETTPDNTIDWSVTYAATQTSNTSTFGTLEKEDLTYSNNIQADATLGKNGVYRWDYANDKYSPDLTGDVTHKNGQMVFTQKEGAQTSDLGHFDKGHLVFKHALSRLTVQLVEGTGFNNSADTDFKFNKISGSVTSGNIQLLSFPVHGKLNVQTGVWTTDASDGTQNILQMIGAAATASTSTLAAATNADKYTAQMLPGKKFFADANGSSAGDNVMQFCIDDNTYYITQKMVYDALNTTENTNAGKVTVKTESSKNYIEMEQGKNYTLKLTVNKTGIASVTATLEPWVDVAGSHEVNNAHITLALNTSGTTCDKDIDLYRLGDDNTSYDANQYDFTYAGTNWFGNYVAANKVTLSKNAYDASSQTDGYKTDASSNKYWVTPWYFESNKTYYHFRTVNSGTTINNASGTFSASNADYFNIEAGATASTDPHWGAPMKTASGVTWLKYDVANGYEAHLNPAIGATESKIAIQELHMMSNINVILTTPNDGGKVELSKTENGTTTNTIVKITRMYKKGTVEMGRGLVTPLTSEAVGEVTMTAPTTFWKVSTPASGEKYETNAYSFTVVPQQLYRHDGTTQSQIDDDDYYIGIFIQTPDQNQYYVVKKLSEIIATSVSDERDQTKDQKITRWYPGHTYTYTFNVTKTKIEVVSCTVADWVTVTGANTGIDLES